MTSKTPMLVTDKKKVIKSRYTPKEIPATVLGRMNIYQDMTWHKLHLKWDKETASYKLQGATNMFIEKIEYDAAILQDEMDKFRLASYDRRKAKPARGRETGALYMGNIMADVIMTK